MTTGAREIARRRLAQSEEEFRIYLAMNDRDEYVYVRRLQRVAGEMAICDNYVSPDAWRAG